MQVETSWFHNAFGRQVWKKNAIEGYGDLMSEETWTADELFDGMTLQPGFITELEKLGLIRAVARDVEGGSLYSAEARDELEKVLALVELGYKLEDIAAIAKRVGLPAKKNGLFRRLPLRMRSAELARRSGVDPVRIDRWVKEGHLRADLVSESGARLFDRSAIEGVRLLADLEDAGVDDEGIGRVLQCLAPVAAKQTPEELGAGAAFLMDLTKEIRTKRDAIRRLERELSAGRKRLIRARRSADATRRKKERGRGSRARAKSSSGDGG